MTAPRWNGPVQLPLPLKRPRPARLPTRAGSMSEDARYLLWLLRLAGPDRLRRAPCYLNGYEPLDFAALEAIRLAARLIAAGC
jgi:hypothetical protein